MFKVITHKGFQITFDNGWTVSVMFGGGNYCENQDDKYWMPNDETVSVYECNTAEVAAWDKDNNWFDFGDDKVNGWCEPNYVADFIQRVKNF